MARDVWLVCSVHLGMFSDEYAVLVRTIEGQWLSFFIPREFVEISHRPTGNEEVEGKVKVEVFGGDEHSRIIGLPSQPFEGPRFARVSKEVLALA